MQRVNLKPDTLDQENRRFSQEPLSQPVFLNSVPKSGSHLLRNVVRMFVPVGQQYQRQFIQFANLEQHRQAFNTDLPMLSWGHLPFSDESAMELHGVRKVQLVRDPYSWVIARARFFVSGEFEGNLDFLKQGRLSVEELMNLMIFGIYQRAPSLGEIYTHHALAWLGTGVRLVRYEDLVRHLSAIEGRAAKAYFEELLDACGIAMPDDWRERVKAGADPRQSGTARENLSIQALFEFPSELPSVQRNLVDVAVPGLRQALGYG